MAAPRAPEWDSTLALWREGYPFVLNRCERLRSDVFIARLGLERTVCLRGREAAEFFYDESRFRRRDALPEPFLAVLQGRGVAASLDDEPRLRRKRAIMALMTPERVRAFRDDFERRWREREAAWAARGEIRLHDELRDLLGETMIDWAGLGRLRAEDRRTLIESAVASLVGVSPFRPAAHLAARRARAAADAILRREIEATRAGRASAGEGAALHAVSFAQEAGARLPIKVASAELENLIRPAVAIGRFIVYGAAMLAERPERRAAIRKRGEAGAREAALETRRLCPLFPFIPARARGAFEWRGARFEDGTRAILDIYATNRHPDLYEAPDDWRPERWRDVEPDSFGLIPQGGGPFEGHRCAGEWITQACVEAAMARLAALDWEAGEGAAPPPLDRLPTAPPKGFPIRVRRSETAAA